jgi:hypothetical protein
MNENIFDEELADRFAIYKRKCKICGIVVEGRKVYCNECFEKHQSDRHKKNYMLHKARERGDFEKFYKEARALLKDIDLSKYGVKKAK